MTANLPQPAGAKPVFTFNTPRFLSEHPHVGTRHLTNFDLLALPRLATYSGSVVKQPFGNEKEKPAAPDAFSTVTDNKADSIARRMASGGIRIPRGVYRFKTHEEADEWWDRMIARSQPKKD